MYIADTRGGKTPRSERVVDRRWHKVRQVRPNHIYCNPVGKLMTGVSLYLPMAIHIGAEKLILTAVRG